MFLLEWTASDLLLMALAGILITGLVVWLVPAAQVPHKQKYTSAEIAAYDGQIPHYFLAAAVALILGSFHIIVKSIPGFWQWLWQAGYGGHLFRDLSNSHIIIVGGGTVLLTGITWYVLPRFVNRPLYSTALARASLWFTVIGVFGFYLAWLVLGLVEGNMVAHGWEYMAAKEALGSWHTVPTRITSSIMGVGYWTYVLNVLLTVWVARHVSQKPFNYLTKFVVVSAAALFVGTVQGVLQVLPANADWIHYAGKFGQFVDPISHAHINLVTGMMVSLGGFLIYFNGRLGGQSLSKRSANLLFWTLVPGSLIFYLAFLLLGLILGGAIQTPRLATFAGQHMRLILAGAGTLMLASFWVYFILLWRSLGLQAFWHQVKQATPKAFWLISTLALMVGTFQGLLQVLPTTAYFLTTPEEVPNIHAQLNMIGGVLLSLIGLVYLLLPELVGQPADRRLMRRSLWGISIGIGAYYLTTLLSGLLRLSWMRQGYSSEAAAIQLGWLAPLLLLVTAVPMCIGFVSFGLAVYRVTPAHRKQAADEFRAAPARFSGPMPARLKRIPLTYLAGMEFVSGLFGFPGPGWLFAGQALPAVILMLVGPGIAWALLPILFSPFSNTIFSQWGWQTVLVWLPLSAVVSSGLLAWKVRKMRAAQLLSQAAVQTTDPPLAVTTSIRIPRGVILGTALVLLALFSIPLIPLIAGIPDAMAAQQMMSDLPDRANGAYLSLGDGTQSGVLKLFPWSIILDEFPPESPTVNPSHLQNLLISQKGLDTPDRYLLYYLEDEDTAHLIPLEANETVFQRQLVLSPLEQSLPPGNYMLNIPTGGMFAGREYYYFRIDPGIGTLPPLAASPEVAAMAVDSNPATNAGPGWLNLLPLSSAVISGVMVLLMLNRMRQKIRPQEAAWTLAFAMFAVAAGSQVWGDVAGWSPFLARLYYVFGASLVVGWLGLGTWLVVVHTPWLRQLGLWVMLFISGLAIGLASQSPVDVSRLAIEGWHALEKPTMLTVLTIAVNSLGTLILVGGALWSAWVFWRKRMMRSRMVGLLLLAGGALTVAAGGSLTRLGHQQYLYIAMSIGVSLMFWGYLKTIRVDVLERQTVISSMPTGATSPQASTGD